MVRYTPLHASGRLSKDDFAIIREQLCNAERGIRKFSKFKNIQHVDVIVDGGHRFSELPVLGYAVSGHRLDMTVDPEFPCYRDSDNKELSVTFFHEMHHVLRQRRYGSPVTLEETLVSEGLAQVFSEEAGLGTSSYSLNLYPDEIRYFERRACLHIRSGKPFYANAWRFGSTNLKETKKGDRFKRWTAYSLGYAIVKSWLAYNKNIGNYPQTAADAVDVRTEDIIRPWFEKKFDVLQAYPVLTRATVSKTLQMCYCCTRG